MSHSNRPDILQSPRVQAQLDRIRKTLAWRNRQLHATEQQLTHSEQQLKITVRGYRQVLGLVVLALIVLIAILVMGGFA
ncbi:hypothetical protein [Psychrobacter sp. 72-O-c]|uniref:hypothetical protein n=1 Tax=Psychrobacter sp. 72-O-c TaxID=2774125 RepID=UPI00191B30B4|nr:hypothetical protein [Psychrobacter sp. 72-O-c]